MIFCINITSGISKLLYVISRAVRGVKFETILKYHEWYLCQISLHIMLLFVYTTTHKRFVIFTCRYFKLSWSTTALSQSNCRNFSCSSIILGNFGGRIRSGFEIIVVRPPNPSQVVGSRKKKARSVWGLNHFPWGIFIHFYQ